MEMLNQKQKIIVIIIIAVVAVVIAYYYINSTKEVYTNYGVENAVEQIAEESVEQKKQKIKIHITGAIKTNGIVEVEENSRINDVIEAAGGITEDADLTNVNLAYVVEDGQKIYIPSIDDKNNERDEEDDDEDKENKIIFTGAGNGIIDEEETGTLLININKATVAEIMTLPGIGESTAAKIIEYRKKNGVFKKIEDIKNVSGIGEAKFNTIKEFISV